MTRIDDAIELLSDGPLLNRIDRHNADQFVEAVATVVGAIRNAPQYEWCNVHFCRGQNDWCWAWVAGVAPRRPCELETVRVIFERTEQ